MRSRSQKTSWLLAVVWLTAMPSAVAQTPQSGTRQPLADACILDQECSARAASARSLSDAGQWNAAFSAYQAAHARRPAPWLLVQMGRMQQKLGNPEEAIRLYQQFAASPESDNYSDYREAARRYKQEAIQDLVHRQPSGQPTEPAASSERTPVYKKWWFWTVLIGGAVVVTAVGVGVGLATRPKTPAVPDGVSAFEISF